MLIKIKPSWDISENEVTSEEIYLNRRSLLKVSGLLAASSVLPSQGFSAEPNKNPTLNFKKNNSFLVTDSDRSLTKEDLATSYNNFYEFSLDKDNVKDKVNSWNLDPGAWSIEVSGLKSGSKKLFIQDLIKMTSGLEERIYRFRCVEAWSMVLPWIGIPFAEVIKKLDPKVGTKFVKFQSFADTKIGSNMTKLPHYPWPYTEGLTIEEAMNPLTLLATGLYGKELRKQNGAPLRLVVPWKYGFKNIKSIVKIEFTDKQPRGLWENLAADEYGFYANVNPDKDHPRWSQKSERVIDGKFFPSRIKTLKYNGYEKEVAGLYKGLDLQKFY